MGISQRIFLVQHVAVTENFKIHTYRYSHKEQERSVSDNTTKQKQQLSLSALYAQHENKIVSRSTTK